MIVHTLRQKQFHGDVEFTFIGKKGSDPRKDPIYIIDGYDGNNINDILTDVNGEMLGEWLDPREASLLDLANSTGYLNSPIEDNEKI